MKRHYFVDSTCDASIPVAADYSSLLGRTIDSSLLREFFFEEQKYRLMTPVAVPKIHDALRRMMTSRYAEFTESMVPSWKTLATLPFAYVKHLWDHPKDDDAWGYLSEIVEAQSPVRTVGSIDLLAARYPADILSVVNGFSSCQRVSRLKVLVDKLRLGLFQEGLFSSAYAILAFYDVAMEEGFTCDGLNYVWGEQYSHYNDMRQFFRATVGQPYVKKFGRYLVLDIAPVTVWEQIMARCLTVTVRTSIAHFVAADCVSGACGVFPHAYLVFPIENGKAHLSIVEYFPKAWVCCDTDDFEVAQLSKLEPCEPGLITEEYCVLTGRVYRRIPKVETIGDEDLEILSSNDGIVDIALYAKNVISVGGPDHDMDYEVLDDKIIPGELHFKAQVLEINENVDEDGTAVVSPIFPVFNPPSWYIIVDTMDALSSKNIASYTVEGQLDVDGYHYVWHESAQSDRPDDDVTLVFDCCVPTAYPYEPVLTIVKTKELFPEGPAEVLGHSRTCPGSAASMTHDWESGDDDGQRDGAMTFHIQFHTGDSSMFSYPMPYYSACEYEDADRSMGSSITKVGWSNLFFAHYSPHFFRFEGREPGRTMFELITRARFRGIFYKRYSYLLVWLRRFFPKEIIDLIIFCSFTQGRKAVNRPREHYWDYNEYLPLVETFPLKRTKVRGPGRNCRIYPMVTWAGECTEYLDDEKSDTDMPPVKKMRYVL